MLPLAPDDAELMRRVRELAPMLAAAAHGDRRAHRPSDDSAGAAAVGSAPDDVQDGYEVWEESVGADDAAHSSAHPAAHVPPPSAPFTHRWFAAPAIPEPTPPEPAPVALEEPAAAAQENVDVAALYAAQQAARYGAQVDDTPVETPGDGDEDRSWAAVAGVGASPLHVAQPAAVDGAVRKSRAHVQVCRFFIQGICRYGTRCRYVHGDMCAFCQKPVLHPDRPDEAAAHQRECYARRLAEHAEVDMGNPAPASGDVEGGAAGGESDAECAICFEAVAARGKRFGLLSGCTHAFCLDCIRQWRAMRETQGDVARVCPICRSESHFIVPSRHFVTGAAKEALVREYKDGMRTIPCRHFDFGRGSCPFGTSCFYAHLNEDGTSADTPSVRTRQKGSFEVEVVKDVQLWDFLEHA